MDIGVLRSICDDEIELMRSWRNSSLVQKNMYTRHEIGRQEHREWWERMRDSPVHRYFMYEYQHQPCGIVGFTGIDCANSNSFWAFYASPDAGKGTGTRMEFLALDYAFASLGLHKLQCEVLAFNVPVISLHKKFGFAVEGILRGHHKMDDEFVDVYRLGILSQEWQDHRPAMESKLASFAQT